MNHTTKTQTSRSPAFTHKHETILNNAYAAVAKWIDGLDKTTHFYVVALHTCRKPTMLTNQVWSDFMLISHSFLVLSGDNGRRARNAKKHLYKAASLFGKTHELKVRNKDMYRALECLQMYDFSAQF